MVRLHVVVEGQTEETFVKRVLLDYLVPHSVYTDVRCVETSRSKRRGRIYRGGVIDYGRAKRDIVRWMKQDRNKDARFTTMFDLFRLPSDFPGFPQAKQKQDPYEKVEVLEAGLRGDIDDPRFLPYIQLHEFEALVLCDPSKLRLEFLNREEAIRNLERMCAGFDSPELIDDGDETAPSKRIIRELPEYEGRKPSAGPRIIRETGLDVIARKCPHFSEWLQGLAGLVTTGM